MSELTAFDRLTDALVAHGEKVTTSHDKSSAAAQCPAHDDRAASLSIGRGDDCVLVKCHAGCALDDILTALQWSRRDLFDAPKDRKNGYQVVAEYPYVDEQGNVLYVKERRWPKDFRQYRPLANGEKEWKLGDQRRVLYRLPDVLAAIEAGQTVYLVEGEKDADALVAAGVTATTWPEGAWKEGARPKWRDQYTATLTGATVVLVRDNDDAGRNTAHDIRKALSGAVASLSLVDPKEGKDATDHLAAGFGVEDFQGVLIMAPGDGGDGKSPGPSQATLLRGMALQRYELGRSEDGRPYAVAEDGPRIARPFKGSRSGLRAELAEIYAEEHGGSVPSSSALTDALTALEGVAQRTDPWKLGLRVAEHDEAIWLDLGHVDGRSVRLGAGGWRITEECPVLWRRTALVGAMPEPVSGGGLGPLRSRLNVSNQDWPLLLAWMVAALIPTIPHPIVLLTGEQGTGKSTATRLIVTIVDPSPAPLRTGPRNSDQWAVTAAASWVVGLDNLSDVDDWFSDALCRAATGDGVVKRELYSDDGVTVLTFQRCILANGINLGKINGDLADRMVTVKLEPIEAASRRTAGDVEIPEAEHAEVLGALLDLACQVLARLPEIHLDEMPRMADFARVLSAVDAIEGTKGLERYIEQAKEMADAVAGSSQVTTAIRALVEQHGSWTGTVSELHAALNEHVPEPAPKDWPRTVQAATAALTRAAPVLRQLGFVAEQGNRTKTKRPWTLTAPPSPPAGPATGSPDTTLPSDPRHHVTHVTEPALTWENEGDEVDDEPVLDQEDHVTASPGVTWSPPANGTTSPTTSPDQYASDLGEYVPDDVGDEGDEVYQQLSNDQAVW